MKESTPTYVVTQDTRSLFQRVSYNGELSQDFLTTIDTYFTTIQQCISDGIPDVKVVGFYEADINMQLAQSVRGELNTNPDSCCIILDRYLLPDVEKEFPERFFRFSITRTIDGKKTPRPGDLSFAEQIQNMVQKTPDLEQKPIIMVDDGIFSGGTIKDTVGIFDTYGIKLRVQSVIGFVGQKRNTVSSDDIRPVILQPIKTLYDWVDIRDFGPLGGKIFKTSKNNRVATTIPYLYPWSYGEDASLNTTPDLFSISSNLIIGLRKVITEFEQQSNQTLRFRDLVNRGFALPVTGDTRAIPISINDRVIDYLDRCVKLIKFEQQRKVFVFDMDGTLYQLDGEDNGYKSSCLESTVKKNAIYFIMKRENCTSIQAEDIYTSGISDPIGLSKFLGQRYSISREEYFDNVWNIDPQEIIQIYSTPITVIKRIAKTDAKLILLTSAPKIWARKVLVYLGVADCFEIVFTGEQFKTKEDIFQLLASWYQPTNICSIGDQEGTDIIPARKNGLNTLVIRSEGDFEELSVNI